MSEIQFTRLPGYDKNGNPRYVVHFLQLLTEREKSQETHDTYGLRAISTMYAWAVKRAHKIGGRKYHTKAYGGGIVFTDYENVIREHIKRVVAEAEEQETTGG